MKSPLAESERERLVAALLPDVAFDGWTRHSLRSAARRAGIPVGEAMALFPRGAPDLIAAFSRWADHEMLERLAAVPAPANLSRRVALALRLRFEVLMPWREAVRRGLSVLAMPQHALRWACACSTTRSMRSGTGSATLRPISAFIPSAPASPAIYAAATLFWLDDRSPDFTDTQAFIDRRLADLHHLAGCAPARRRRPAEPIAPAASLALIGLLTASAGGRGWPRPAPAATHRPPQRPRGR